MTRNQKFAIGIFALTLACFCRVCACDFISLDDDFYITKNPSVLGGLTWPNVRWAFTDSCYVSGMWFPLTWLSLQVDATLFGPSGAWGFHLTNLLLHGAVVVLFFLCLKRMTGALHCSAIAAMLFAVHPLRVESVAWVTERKDVLSALFLTLTLFAYYHYAERPSLGRYALVFGSYLLGLMCKPSLVTMPFALLLLDYWPLYRLRLGDRVLKESRALTEVNWKHLVLEKLPLLTLGLLFSALTMHFHTVAGTINSEVPLLDRLQVGVSGVLSNIENTLWPVKLGVLYPFQLPSPARAVLAALVVLSITAGVCYLARSQPALFVGWFWFLGTLVPNSGVVQAGPQAFADRFTYVPHLGLFAGIVWTVNGLAVWERIPAWAQKSAVPVIIVLGYLSWGQTSYWRNSEVLFKQTLSVTENNFGMHYSLGNYYLGREDLDKAFEHFEGALAAAEASIGRPAEYGHAHYYVGRLGVQQGRRQQGRHHLHFALSFWDEYPPRNPSVKKERTLHQAQALQVLGEIELAEGRPQAALHYFRIAGELCPEDARSLQFTGIALALLARWEQAENALRNFTDLAPNDAIMRGYMAYVIARQGKMELAAQNYARLREQFPGWIEQNNNLAMTLITNPRVFDFRMAEELATQICEATEFRDARWLNTLAATQAAAGNFAKAKETATIALRLASDPGLIEQLRARINRYDRGEALPPGS